MSRSDPLVTRSDPLPEILLPRDVARVFGISVHGARERMRRGRLPAVRLGGRWVLRRAALLQAIERLEHERSRGLVARDEARETLRAALPAPRRGSSRRACAARLEEAQSPERGTR